VLHRTFEASELCSGFGSGEKLCTDLYGFVPKSGAQSATNGAACLAGHATPVEGDQALTKRKPIAAAFMFTVLATTACGGQDVAVKPAATTSQTTPATSSPASRLTPTIDPKAQPAVAAYLNFVAARAEALKSPRQLGKNYLPAADFTKFSFDPVRGQANASIVSLAEQGLLFKGDPGRPRVIVAAIEPNAKPYPKVVLKDCPTPTPTWRIYDAKTGKDVTLPLPAGTQPTPYLSKVEVIYYQGRWGVSKIDADTSRTCTA
jgi:hypothetical protein